jgi:DNA-binding transcriptional regulator YiaG
MDEDLSYQVELIERVKKELGMSQSDIARKFEMGKSSVSEWVNQKVKMKPPYRIALELMLKDKKQQEVIAWVQKFPQIMKIIGQDL